MMIRHQAHALKSGGEPPHNGDMEARVLKLEDFALETRDRLTRIEISLGHVEKEVGNFKWWVIAQIVAALLTIIGTGIAIQQMTVATFQAAAAHVAPAQAQQAPIIINVPAAPAAAPVPPSLK